MCFSLTVFFSDMSFLSCCRIGRVSKKVPSLLVQVCQHVPHLGVLSLLAEDQACGLLNCDGPICRPRHYHLHCPQHPLHGDGALPHDSSFWGRLVHWQLGEKLQFTFSFVEPPLLVFISDCTCVLLASLLGVKVGNEWKMCVSHTYVAVCYI